MVQRVSSASVAVDGAVTGAVGRGVLLLVAIAATDTEAELRWMAQKVATLRIFPDDDGKMNLGLVDLGLGALVVSQFTLYGDARKGRRPSFLGSAPPDVAKPAWERFCALLEGEGVRPVGRGVFGADMQVTLTNDGPVTLILDTP